MSSKYTSWIQPNKSLLYSTCGYCGDISGDKVSTNSGDVNVRSVVILIILRDGARKRTGQASVRSRKPTLR